MRFCHIQIHHLRLSRYVPFSSPFARSGNIDKQGSAPKVDHLRRSDLTSQINLGRRLAEAAAALPSRLTEATKLRSRAFEANLWTIFQPTVVVDETLLRQSPSVRASRQSSLWPILTFLQAPAVAARRDRCHQLMPLLMLIYGM